MMKAERCKRSASLVIFLVNLRPYTGALNAGAYLPVLIGKGIDQRGEAPWNKTLLQGFHLRIAEIQLTGIFVVDIAKHLIFIQRHGLLTVFNPVKRIIRIGIDRISLFIDPLILIGTVFLNPKVFTVERLFAIDPFHFSSGFLRYPGIHPGNNLL